MSVATITSKGRMTLPKDIRTLLKVGPGDRVRIRARDDGVVTIEAEALDLRSLRGRLKSRRPEPLTVEQMDEAIRSSGAVKP
jgi:AbrB family looped-hinge helix DNA binding protein